MTAPIPDATGVIASSPRSAARRARPVVLQLAARRPLAFGSLVFLLLVLVVAVVGPCIAPYDPLSGDLAASMQGPSWAHLLGTDQLGRDTFSRLLVGTGPTVLYTSLVVIAALVVGVLLGMVAGYAGRQADAVIMALSDILLSLPGMVMLLVILTVFQDVMWIAMLCIGVLMSGVLMRVIRATALSFRQEAFIEAAGVAGLPQWMVLWRHVLPRISSAVLVQGSMLIGMALLLVTGAAYLGFGTNPPYPSWGLMIGDGAQIFGTQPWLMVSAGVVTALTAMSAAMLGEGVRDVTTERWSGQRVHRRAPRRPGHRHAAPAPV
ncbi:MAG: ABC transporter permease, partial [Microbacterium sp.]|uniref:ABC transporter permease n=1 Tax=Microbacterium sp. TaxID=51671 RepID=UPI0039E3AA04